MAEHQDQYVWDAWQDCTCKGPELIGPWECRRHETGVVEAADLYAPLLFDATAPGERVFFNPAWPRQGGMRTSVRITWGVIIGLFALAAFARTMAVFAE